MRFYYTNKLNHKDLKLQSQKKYNTYLDLGKAGRYILSYTLLYLGKKKDHTYEVLAKTNIIYLVLIFSSILACSIAYLVDRLEILYYLPFLILLEFTFVRAAIRSKTRRDFDQLLIKQHARRK